MASLDHAFSESWRKTVRAFHEGGLGHLIARAFQKLSAPIVEFGSIVFFGRNLDQELPKSPSSDELTLRQASRADMNLLLQDDDRPHAAEKLRRRFDRGDFCFIALDAEGKLAHSRWATTGSAEIPELGMEIVLNREEAYFYDGYTRPDLRGRGIDGYIRLFIFNSTRALGARWIYSYVRGDNPVAFRAAQRWQQRLGRVWYMRVRGLKPIVIGYSRLDLNLRSRAATGEDEQEKSRRVQIWREWFESWLEKPMTQRSTGFYDMPEEYFVATAKYISETLQLNPLSDAVLDVGCDSAMISRLVAPRSRRFVGVDFIPGLLAQIPKNAIRGAAGRPASLVAADGRHLPFREGVFDKAYCSAVLQTLPSHEDGFKIIEALTRACRPGGKILVSSVPDTAKRLVGYLEMWRRGGMKDRLMLLGSLLTPRPLKDLLSRLLGLKPRYRLVCLEYDLKKIKSMLDARGFHCQILHFPEQYPSRDFRKTRSNLLIQKPMENKAGV
ncbi:MAG: class I SAM-dependent methyltransferase [Deltaproteobacteria bacterium]|nr:class I SAM-dependent methyltransferase [Deltaproteobacteria bacterium]